MQDSKKTDVINIDTVHAFARTIVAEARKYGFSEVDIIRLISAIVDETSGATFGLDNNQPSPVSRSGAMQVDEFPLQGNRLTIRRCVPSKDLEIVKSWLRDEYGKHFLLSCASAQETRIEEIVKSTSNEIGIIEADSSAIGAVAFLDIDPRQKRAELRKVIGDRNARGKGFAEEATMLWIKYGKDTLGLEKIYVSTLQTHLRNVKLNESVGFRVEGVLREEVLIDGTRHDVLRMGLCLSD